MEGKLKGDNFREATKKSEPAIINMVAGGAARNMVVESATRRTRPTGGKWKKVKYTIAGDCKPVVQAIQGINATKKEMGETFETKSRISKLGLKPYEGEADIHVYRR